MIVTCQNCDTSFELDEARVPPQGIRVRCSRCKEAFFLEHPSTSRSDAVHGVAEAAVESGGVATPESTHDLDGSTSSGERASTGAGLDSDGEFDEEDWEFNVEVPEDEGDEAGLDREHADESSGLDLAEPDPVDSGVSLDLAEDESDETLGEEDLSQGYAESDASDDAAAPVADDSAFGSIDDYASLAGEDAASVPDLGVASSGEDSGLEVEGEMPDEAPDRERSIDPPAFSVDAIGHHAGTGGSDDLGDPESWDFLSDAALESRTSTSGAGGEERMPALEPAPANESVSARDGREDWDEDLYSDSPGEDPSWLRGLKIAGHSIGWLTTGALVALGLASGLWSTAASLVTSPQIVEMGGELRAEGIRGQWLDTARSVALLAVSGELRNTSSGRITPPGALQVALLDAEGRRLDTPPVPVGIVGSEAEARELPWDALWEARSRAARALAGTVLEPASSVAFQAYFIEVPIEAARFALEPAPVSFDPLSEAPGVGPGVARAGEPIGEGSDFEPADTPPE